jgi:hypothetical protein
MLSEPKPSSSLWRSWTQELFWYPDLLLTLKKDKTYNVGFNQNLLRNALKTVVNLDDYREVYVETKVKEEINKEIVYPFISLEKVVLKIILISIKVIGCYNSTQSIPNKFSSWLNDSYRVYFNYQLIEELKR